MAKARTRPPDTAAETTAAAVPSEPAAPAAPAATAVPAATVATAAPAATAATTAATIPPPTTTAAPAPAAPAVVAAAAPAEAAFLVVMDNAAAATPAATAEATPAALDALGRDIKVVVAGALSLLGPSMEKYRVAGEMIAKAKAIWTKLKKAVPTTIGWVGPQGWVKLNIGITSQYAERLIRISEPAEWARLVEEQGERPEAHDLRTVNGAYNFLVSPAPVTIDVFRKTLEEVAEETHTDVDYDDDFLSLTFQAMAKLGFRVKLPRRPMPNLVLTAEQQAMHDRLSVDKRQDFLDMVRAVQQQSMRIAQ